MGLAFPSLANSSVLNKNQANQQSKTKLLIELKGGNDGLNTVVPYSDPLYKELRPTLALPSSEIIKFNNKLAFHHSLESIMPIWEQGQMQVVLGVGYQKPNLSHFRSIEIWDTASASNQYLTNGWLAKNLKTMNTPIAGLVLGGTSGPLQGIDNIIKIRDINQFLKNKSLHNLSHQQNALQNPALMKIIQTQNIIDRASEQIKIKLKPLQAPVEFQSYGFARQASLATQIIQSDLNIPVIKLSLGSFDTHTNQKPRQAKLLKQLADSIVAMQKALVSSGHWSDTTIMTYSEFGRRAAENGSRGTDHGTAAPHFIIGGSVKGGVIGKQPSLANLHQNNLQYTTDFKQLYALAMKS